MAQTKFLFILRHGEAEPGIGRTGDLNRPLTPTGKSYIKKLGSKLKSQEEKFDLVLVSPAKRTMQTAENIQEALGQSETNVEDEIYDAEVSDLLDLLTKIDNKVKKMILIGHNPALSSLVTYLTEEQNVMMKPGYLAVIELNISDWSHLSTNTGILKEIISM